MGLNCALFTYHILEITSYHYLGHCLIYSAAAFHHVHAPSTTSLAPHQRTGRRFSGFAIRNSTVASTLRYSCVNIPIFGIIPGKSLEQKIFCIFCILGGIFCILKGITILTIRNKLRVARGEVDGRDGVSGDEH